MDGPQAPLMADDGCGDERASQDDVRAEPPGDGSKPGVFLLALTLAAGISGLLFGCKPPVSFSEPRWPAADDTGVISATLVSIGRSLSNRALTSLDKSIITSSTSLFALIASPLSSVLADRLGRKQVILLADVLFVVGALLRALCSTVPLMVAGRCVVGATVGAASFFVPLYMAEVAPASHRGRLVTTNVLFVTMGQMAAYVVGSALSAFAPREMGWRWMVGLGALPAALQAAVIVLMPETPRWLVKVGRSAAARQVVQSVSGGDADSVVKQIEMEARRLRH